MPREQLFPRTLWSAAGPAPCPVPGGWLNGIRRRRLGCGWVSTGGATCPALAFHTVVTARASVLACGLGHSAHFCTARRGRSDSRVLSALWFPVSRTWPGVRVAPLWPWPVSNVPLSGGSACSIQGNAARLGLARRFGPGLPSSRPSPRSVCRRAPRARAPLAADVSGPVSRLCVCTSLPRRMEEAR